MSTKIIALRLIQTSIVLAGTSCLLLITGLLVPATRSSVRLASQGVLLKVSNRAPDCPWPMIFEPTNQSSSRVQQIASIQNGVTIVESDATRGIALYQVGTRRLWAPKQEDSSRWLLGYLLVEQTESSNDPAYPRAGDIVIDGGAHIGVMSMLALENGAKRVVAVEPDETNRECLSRNLAAYVEAGRVLICDKALWNSQSTLQLNLAASNSGGHSIALRNAGHNGSTLIRTTTVDALVRDYQLDRLDFIKLDIEGAEREALRGAIDSLKRFKPRLMIDSYHRPDDIPVFRAIIQNTVPEYRYYCDSCYLMHGMLVPHVSFFEVR